MISNSLDEITYIHIYNNINIYKNLIIKAIINDFIINVDK